MSKSLSLINPKTDYDGYDISRPLRVFLTVPSFRKFTGSGLDLPLEGCLGFSGSTKTILKMKAEYRADAQTDLVKN